MKKIILIFVLLMPYFVFSQTYREYYFKRIILNENTDDNNNLYIIEAPTLTQSVTFTIPVGDGNVGDVLTTNGLNSTSWSGLDINNVGGTGDYQVQFKNNSFGGSASFIWQSTDNRLGVGVSSPSYTLHVSNTINIGSSGNRGSLALHSNNSSGNYLYILPNSSTTQTNVFVLPANNGEAGKGLISNSSGSLSWGGDIFKGPVSNNEPDAGNSINNSADNAYIGGGSDNDITNSANNSTVYGGNNNDIQNSGSNSSLFGGSSNLIGNTSYNSIAPGGYDNTFNNSSYSAALVGGTLNIFSNTAHYSIIAGGNNNSFNNSTENSIIFNGSGNELTNSIQYGVIGAGSSNDLTGNHAALFVGNTNAVDNNSSNHSVLLGGESNQIYQADYAFLGAGQRHLLKDYSVILAGDSVKMKNSTNYTAVLYGRNMDFSGGGEYSIMAGRDIEMKNSGDYSMHFGRKLDNNSAHDGVMLLGDSNTDVMQSGSNNVFKARFSNGYRFWTNAAANVGVGMDAGANAWSSVSDRNLKEAIVSLNPTDFLNKIKKLDIFSWSYIGFEDKGIRNYGPMAQDFYSLFGEDEYGTYGDNKSIKELDAAAIFILGVQGSKVEFDNQTKSLENAIENSDEIDFKLRELERKLESLEKEIK